MRTESGLSLNDFTQTAPANVPSLRGILIDPDSTPTTPSTTFRSSSDLYPPATSTPTSGLSVFQPTPSPAPLLQTLPGDIFETAQSPLETVHQETMQPAQRSRPSRHSSKIPPPSLQPVILQAVLEDTYIDDRRVGAKSDVELSDLQQEIEAILGKGGFQIKSWECSDENGSSKYLGMTWDRLQDHYLLKFRLNHHKKSRGIPSGADLDSEFLQDHSTPITKKNVFSVACQFYDPTGLAAAPLMFSV